jgi:hypothetical protein
MKTRGKYFYIILGIVILLTFLLVHYKQEADEVLQGTDPCGVARDANAKHIHNEVLHQKTIDGSGGFHETSVENMSFISKEISSDAWTEVIAVQKKTSAAKKRDEAISLASEQYEKHKEKSQVVYGTVKFGVDSKNHIPLRMSIGQHLGQKTSRTIVDENMHFVFPKIAAGNWEVILYETTDTPGVRFEKLYVKEDQPVPEINLQGNDVSIQVSVVDEFGRTVRGANVTVAKQSGGVDENIFTY